MQARASIPEMRLLELYVIAMGLLLPGQPRVVEALAIPDRPVAYQVFEAFQTLTPCLDLIEALLTANAKSHGGIEADFESRTAHEHLFNLCVHLQRSSHAWPFRPLADTATEPRGCVSLLLSAFQVRYLGRLEDDPSSRQTRTAHHHRGTGHRCLQRDCPHLSCMEARPPRLWPASYRRAKACDAQ